MTRHEYVVLDVFTDVTFGGKHLAVVIGGGWIDA